MPGAASIKSMSAATILDQLRSLTPEERREIVGRIWDEFADRDLVLTSTQITELDRRLVDHRTNPNDVVPWQQMKSAIEAKYDRR